MSTTLIRSYSVPGIELRGTEGRTIYGLAAPIGKPADIYENGEPFAETIERGAFLRTIQQRGRKVPLLALHDSRRLPLAAAHSPARPSTPRGTSRGRPQAPRRSAFTI